MTLPIPTASDQACYFRYIALRAQEINLGTPEEDAAVWAALSQSWGYLQYRDGGTVVLMPPTWRPLTSRDEWIRTVLLEHGWREIPIEKYLVLSLRRPPVDASDLYEI